MQITAADVQALVKSYYANKAGIDPKMVCVSVILAARRLRRRDLKWKWTASVMWISS